MQDYFRISQYEWTPSSGKIVVLFTPIDRADEAYVGWIAVPEDRPRS